MNRLIFRATAAAAAALLLAPGPTALARDAPQTSQTGEHYYAVVIKGKAVGYFHDVVTFSPDASRLKETSDDQAKAQLMGMSLDSSDQTVAEYSAASSLPLSYAGTSIHAGATQSYKIVFHPQSADYMSVVGGHTTRKSVALPPATVLLASLDSWQMILRRAAPGASAVSASIFDTDQGAVEKITLSRQAEKTGNALYTLPDGTRAASEVWTTDLPNGLGGTLHTVLTVRKSDKLVLAQETPDTSSLIRLADKRALRGFGSFDYTDQLLATVATPLPPAQLLTSLKLKVAAQVNSEQPSFASLQFPGRQEFAGDARGGDVSGVFTIDAFHYNGAHAPAFPYSSETTAALTQWLQPTQFAESDDPKIRALARSLTQGCPTGWDAAEKIGRWVSANISYVLTGSGASECLASRRGDCGPHSWLTIALCRAAGIPARLVGGALYTATLGGSYGQHYWTEVWMGKQDGWVPIDTTTGEVGTLSPAHLTLWQTGGMRSLSVKVLSYAPAATLASTQAATAAAEAALHPNGLAAGYQETYTFTIAGKEIGTQTGTLASVAPDGNQTWRLLLHLSVPRNGQVLDLRQSATLVVTGTDVPVSLSLVTSAQGVSQTSDATFKPDVVTATVGLGSAKAAHTIPLTGPISVCLGNQMTTWSLMARAQRPGYAQPLPVTLFFADSLQSIPFTLTPLRADTITIPDYAGGKPIACHVFALSPAGGDLWLSDTTGELLKLEDTRQQLMIARSK